MMTLYIRPTKLTAFFVAPSIHWQDKARRLRKEGRRAPGS